MYPTTNVRERRPILRRRPANTKRQTMVSQEAVIYDESGQYTKDVRAIDGHQKNLTGSRCLKRFCRRGHFKLRKFGKGQSSPK
ncbi:hypothetical protein RUM44_006129 [Polyplax serrata]|uniref:Uncharacterized protein n=1 Tax=Polyplax serrata TaxID=468196 RepID=A0ABR1AZ07_POLSC